MDTNITYLTPKKIKQEVARTRGQYMNYYSNELPFNAELFLEREHGMRIIPVPHLKSLSIECSYCRGNKAILIDEADYNDPSKKNRLAFTFAHELGHKVLHAKYLPFVSAISADDMEKIEVQARMFAAEFLMPEHLVLGVIANEILNRLNGIVGKDLTIETCIEYKIHEIAAYFGVSVPAMRHRISNIDVASVLSGPYISHTDIANLQQLSQTIAPQASIMKSTVRDII